MNILHVTSITNPEGNGVAVAVNNYIVYEEKYAKVSSYNLEGKILNKHSKCYSADEYKNIAELPEPFNKPDLVIFNEVYKPQYIKLYKEINGSEPTFNECPKFCYQRTIHDTNSEYSIY